MYFVDCDKALLAQYRERLFPGSRKLGLIECDPARTQRNTCRETSGVDLLADLLLTWDDVVITGDEIERVTGHPATGTADRGA